MHSTLTFTKKIPNLESRKVGLIIPPSPFLLDERVFVSLGILKVAASLESQKVKVGVLDLSGASNYLDVLKEYIQNIDCDWVGITCTTPQLPAAVNIAKVIKDIAPKLRVVLGGPHVTLTYSAVKVEKKNGVLSGRASKAAKILESYFDVLVTGDGDMVVFELFDPKCPKILDADDHKGPYFMSDVDYENSPMPARHLVDLKSYHYLIDDFPATSLIAQLGCPFQCGFCGGRNSKSLRVIRNRSERSIIEEVKFLYQNYGYTGFMFYDDELNVSKTFNKLLIDLYELQKELQVEFRLRGFIKAELFNEEQAELMYKAGFRWILSGFEAAHPRILTNIDKIATLEDNTRVVKLAHKHNLKVKALMSVGHPGETRETVLSIRDWLIEMEVDDFDCTVITTYPGTPYYDLAVPHETEQNVWTYTHKKTGDRLHSIDLDHTVISDYYKGNPDGGYLAYVFSDFLTPQKLVELRNQVEIDVRKELGIKFNSSKASIKFEHSMGQGLPEIFYRESNLEH
jgi:anaerobic magnesium-protoporphyrin IX monomethyl ester cyclase